MNMMVRMLMNLRRNWVKVNKKVRVMKMIILMNFLMNLVCLIVKVM